MVEVLLASKRILLGKKTNSSHMCMPRFRAYKSQDTAVQVHYFLLRVAEILMQMSFSTWGSRANSLFVCWLVLGKDKHLNVLHGYWSSWSQKAQWEQKRAVGTEKLRHIGISRGNLQQTCQNLRGPHQWNHLGMDIHAAPSQYSQGKCQTRNDLVLSRNNWGTRTASFPALCSRVPVKTCYPGIHLDFSCCSSTCHMPQQLFLATCLFLPTGGCGEGVNSPAPITLPSSHPAFLSCTHLTLHHTTPPLITLFFFWPFSTSTTLYCYVSRETLLSKKVLWEKRLNSAPCLSRLFPPACSWHKPHLRICFPDWNSKGLSFPLYSGTQLLTFFNFSLLNFLGKLQNNHNFFKWR